jgi:hypothetical protein
VKLADRVVQDRQQPIRKEPRLTVEIQSPSLLTQARPIERIHRPSLDDFRRDYMKADRPVIITGLMDDWAALARWTDDYLVERLGDRPIAFWASDDQVFGVAPFKELETEAVPFGEFLARCRDGAAGRRLYLRKGAMKAVLSELMDDIRMPEYVDARWLLSTNMWMGPAGNDTPLHYDLAHNLLAQVRGRKRLVLFKPGDIAGMYPNPFFSNSPHFSRILDLNQVDAAEFPRFREATAYECVVEEGEVLFMPTCWWHQVLSLDMAISVNFWWSPPLDYLHPLVLRTAGTPVYKAYAALKQRLLASG